MDKVQFNTEVVNMRKIVKRVKVLIVHNLTRQVAKLRKKKGSEQQMLKNQRRAQRCMAEIEAMKDLQADAVTKKAVLFNKTLQEVLNNPKSSAQDRVLARVVHHRLIQDRVAKFKGMVTKDLLRTGTKKYRRLRKEKFEAEADARLKEEEVYQDTLEKTVTADKMVESIDDYHDDEEDEEDEEDDGDVDEDDRESFEEMMRMHKRDRDSDDNKSDDGTALKTVQYIEDSGGRVEDSRAGVEQRIDGQRPETLTAHNEERSDDEQSHQISEDSVVPVSSHASISNVPPSRVMGKKKLDSMFLGSLSDLKDDDITEILRKTRQEQLKQKTKMQSRQQIQKLHQKAEPTRGTDDPPTKTKHKIPMVDQPNSVRQTSGEKLIPGINCHPDLPPRHARRRDIHEKKSRKPFPGRPQSKQLPARPPASQSRQKAQHQPTQSIYPTSATVSSPKKPTAKEMLHPSWEASKKRKEASKIVPFQGKKITFDDD